jgi:hypothetical protein
MMRIVSFDQHSKNSPEAISDVGRAAAGIHRLGSVSRGNQRVLGRQRPICGGETYG